MEDLPKQKHGLLHKGISYAVEVKRPNAIDACAANPTRLFSTFIALDARCSRGVLCKAAERNGRKAGKHLCPIP